MLAHLRVPVRLAPAGEFRPARPSLSSRLSYIYRCGCIAVFVNGGRNSIDWNGGRLGQKPPSVPETIALSPVVRMTTAPSTASPAVLLDSWPPLRYSGWRTR